MHPRADKSSKMWTSYSLEKWKSNRHTTQHSNVQITKLSTEVQKFLKKEHLNFSENFVTQIPIPPTVLYKPTDSDETTCDGCVIPFHAIRLAPRLFEGRKRWQSFHTHRLIDTTRREDDKKYLTTRIVIWTNWVNFPLRRAMTLTTNGL